MKLQFVSFLALSLCLIISCAKTGEENPVSNESSLLEFEKRDLTQYEGEILIKEVEPRKYCVWTVTSTVGDSCKYSTGDNICFRCDEDGCPPGIISVGRNFGDGCRTFGEFTDTDCEEKEDGDCAGKYVG